MASKSKPAARTASAQPSQGTRSKRVPNRKGSVRALAFSPCGMMLASGGKDAAIRVWQSSTGEQLCVEKERIPLHTVDHLAFGPGWAEIAIIQSHGGIGRDYTELGIWNAVTREYRHCFKVDDVGEPSVSPTGRALAFGGQGLFWFAPPFRTEGEFPHTGRCNAVAFSADGSLLATASDKQVELYQVETQKRVANWRTEGMIPRSLAFLPDPDRTAIAIGGSDGSVRIWNKKNVTAPWTGEPLPAVKIVAIGGGRVVSIHRNEESDRWSLQLVSVASAARLATHAFADGISAVAVSPDGSYVATGSDTGKVTIAPCESLLPGARPRRLAKPMPLDHDDEI